MCLLLVVYVQDKCQLVQASLLFAACYALTVEPRGVRTFRIPNIKLCLSEVVVVLPLYHRCSGRGLL